MHIDRQPAKKVHAKLTHQARDVAIYVHDSIPAPALERFQVAVPVAGEMFSLLEETRIGAPAGQDCHLVPAGQGFAVI